MHSRFRDADAAIGDLPDECLEERDVRGEVPKVAAVDADDLRAGGDSACDLPFVMRLDKRRHAEVVRIRQEVGKRVVVEDCSYEQHGVRPRRARRRDLVARGEEVLVEQRQSDGPSHVREIFLVAEETVRFAEDREGRGACGLQFACEFHVAEVVADHPLRRRRPLQLRDHAAAAEGRSEIARRRCEPGAGLHRLERDLRFA